MGASGRLMGIARRARPRGAMETIRCAQVTASLGLRGDFRGAPRPGRSNRRQLSIMEAESWNAALSDLGIVGQVPWQERRANLLVEGVRLPRRVGAVIAIGDSLRIETTTECDPCRRMEQVAPGLEAALTPDWRGGVLGRVISEGRIAIGDKVRIEA